jgi:FSR family fosmidomycin resistance protein-like MFS transporter
VAYLLPLLAIVGASLGLVQPVAVALGNKLGKKNPGLVSAFTMGMVWCVAEMVGPGGVGLLTKLFSEDAPAKALMAMGLLYPALILAAYKLPQGEEEAVLATEAPSAVE